MQQDQPVIVFGASPTGLAVLRSLGARGIRCFVADRDSLRHSFWSRYRCGKPIVADNPADLIDLAVKCTSGGKIPIGIPTSDEMILALSEHPCVSQGTLLVHDSIRNGLAAQMVDKQSFHHLCDKVGIVTPRTCFPNTASDLLSAAKTFQFPLLLKPIFGHLWRDRLSGHKLVVVSSENELEALVDGFGTDCSGLMVQELIPGTETNIHVAALFRGHATENNCCFVAEKTASTKFRLRLDGYIEIQPNRRRAKLEISRGCRLPRGLRYGIQIR
jgi:D-aspartate ligase